MGEASTVLLLACPLFSSPASGHRQEAWARPHREASSEWYRGRAPETLAPDCGGICADSCFLAHSAIVLTEGLFKGRNSQERKKRSRQGCGEFWSICRGLLWVFAFPSHFAPCEFGRVRWSP